MIPKGRQERDRKRGQVIGYHVRFVGCGMTVKIARDHAVDFVLSNREDVRRFGEHGSNAWFEARSVAAARRIRAALSRYPVKIVAAIWRTAA